MAANLTRGAITKIFSGACTSKDLIPVLQLIYIDYLKEGKEWRMVMLSDGSCFQYALIPDDIFISNKLQKGDIVRLTMFLLVPEKLFSNNINGALLSQSFIRVCGLDLLRSECHRIGHPKRYPLEETPTSKQKHVHVIDNDDVEEPPTSKQNWSTSTQKCSSHSPTSKQKQDRVDPDLNENIDDSRHVEQPTTSKQNCSFLSPTQNKMNTIMGVSLTPGAITKIMTDKCSSTDMKPVDKKMAVNLTSGAIWKIVTGKSTLKDLKPVLQVIYIDSVTRSIKGKQCHMVLLSDGSFQLVGLIADEIFISNKLHKGDILQLTKFRLYPDKRESISISLIRVSDYDLLCSTCDIIGHPKRLPDDEIPLVERTTPTIPDEEHVEEPPTSKQKQDHVDSLLNENIDDSRHLEEPPTSLQNPPTSTQKCSSHSPTLNKKRKLQSNDDMISGFGNGISKLVSENLEKTIEDGLGACFKKLGTMEEDVSKLTRMMMEKKEGDVGVCFKKLETMEEDVSKLTRMIMEKNKEDAVGFKKLDTLEEHVSKMTKLLTHKSKEVDVGFKKLETLEENVSKKAEIMMDKNKEDDVGACFKKLKTLEENVSKLTRMTMEKNKEDDMGACIEKLERMGWGAQEPLYDTALLLFGQSADYRKLWLHLKPESCGNWVKNAGSMFGLLD